MNIYYIGGSPCAGKSSVAEILSKNMIYTTLKQMISWTDICRQGQEKGIPFAGKSPV